MKSSGIINLSNRNDIIFMICDIQEKKIESSIPSPEKLLKNCKILIECAAILNIPIIVTEHLPNKFGSTHNELQQSLKKCQSYFFEKNTWSMITKDVLYKLNKINKKIVVLFGIETHTCILNTAIDLISNDYNVFIVEDAIRSERDEDMFIGLKRLDKINTYPCSVESCIYEIIGVYDQEFEKCLIILNNLKDDNKFT
jgi:nicotinamidase-related amidase